MKKIILMCLIILTTIAMPISSSKSSGGSIITDLGYGIRLNKESKLQREWVTIQDVSIPAEFVGDVGIKTGYKSSDYSGGYIYQTDFKLKVNKDISAIEIIFITFDLWGKRMTNLSMNEIKEMKSGEVYDLEAEWNLHSENDASTFFTSIAYISAVRTKDGLIIKSNPNDIITVAQKVSKEFSKDDLKPTND